MSKLANSNIEMIKEDELAFYEEKLPMLKLLKKNGYILGWNIKLRLI